MGEKTLYFFLTKYKITSYEVHVERRLNPKSVVDPDLQLIGGLDHPDPGITVCVCVGWGGGWGVVRTLENNSSRPYGPLFGLRIQ